MTPRPFAANPQDDSYEPHTLSFTRSSLDWRIARLALQRRMGLLPERRTWNRSNHSSGPGPARPSLTTPFNLAMDHQ